MFHSIRIIDFGIQIAESNKISNYSSKNEIWENIEFSHMLYFEMLRNKYKPEYNKSMTKFRNLAPKL